MAENLAIVINYCSNDAIFIDAMLRECEKIGAGKVIVVVGTHYYVSMEPENMEHVQDIASKYPWVQFVLYNVYQLTEIQNPLVHRKSAYWHNIARVHGARQVDPDIEWILFLDADEIPEGDRFREWYTTQRRQQKIYKLANYWYFLEPEIQSTTWEDSVMLVPRAACCYSVLMNDLERDGIPILSGLTQERDVVSNVTKLPMFHHFSWVRTKEAMLTKVINWGHKDDTNWNEKVQNLFEKPFDVAKDVDFVHGYKYIRVPNWFGIMMHKNN